jgi:hypothetical protein
MMLLSSVLMIEGRFNSLVTFYVARFLFYESFRQQCVAPSNVVDRDVKPAKTASLYILRQGTDQGLARIIWVARI